MVMTETDTNPTTAQRALDAFLVDNQELEQLTARLSAFNLFSVLRIDHAEIRHSNVLAWLLTPGESHGLGPTFLRRFLSRLLMENDGAAVSLSPAQIELMRFSEIEVLREWQNIDILAHSKAGGWCLLIENKIHSGEGKGQLVRYLDRVKKDFPDRQIIPVYLTLEGDDPSDEAGEAGYLSMSHAQVLDLADQIVNQNCSRIPDDAQVLLDHYLATLRRLTMQDQELVDLCKAIYHKHREAIDMIVEYGTASSVVEAIQAEIESLMDCEFVVPRSAIAWFLPKAMAEHAPTQEVCSWTFPPRKVPILCWCRFAKDRQQLNLIMEVGLMDNPQSRIRLLQAAKESGFKIGKQGFNETAKFTRILRVNQKLSAPDEDESSPSEEYLRQEYGKLWKKFWKDGERIVDVLKEFDWS
jgi:PD-(D/E)XK nuclease superfamily protein